MKTLYFEIPTMTRRYREREVISSVRKLDVVNITTQRGMASVTIREPLLKVDVIRAIEDAGYIVKY